MFLMTFLDILERLEHCAAAEKAEGVQKDILVQLKKILKDQYEANADSRTLIFVSTRASARNLSDYLDQVHDELGLEEKQVGYMTSKLPHSGLQKERRQDWRKERAASKR